MLLSIIIPVYNLAGYIEQCVQSISAQTFTEYEVIIIDDGSTDNTLEVCKEFGKKDDRIKVIHQENQGVSIARNLGIKEAQGDWICFVDGDDQLAEDSLAEIMQDVNQKEPDILIAQSFRHQDGIRTKENYGFARLFLDSQFDGYELLASKNYKRGSVCGAIFNSSFIRRNGIVFPKKLKNGEDSIFMSLCYLYAQKIVFAEVIFYLVNEREGSASRNWDFDRILKMVDNLKFLNSYLTNHPALTNEQTAIIDYSRYGTVSAIFNSFFFCFSWKNLFLLKRRVRPYLRKRIDTKEIKISKSKIRILNLSLDMFVTMVLVNQWWRYKK